MLLLCGLKMKAKTAAGTVVPEYTAMCGLPKPIPVHIETWGVSVSTPLANSEKALVNFGIKIKNDRVTRHI